VLHRHSIGYDALDLASPAGDEKRAFTCSENELQDVIESVGHKFPLGKALATLIRQQWQPISKSQNKKPNTTKEALTSYPPRLLTRLVRRTSDATRVGVPTEARS
jgi:hypothetical protein